MYAGGRRTHATPGTLTLARVLWTVRAGPACVACRWGQAEATVLRFVLVRRSDRQSFVLLLFWLFTVAALGIQVRCPAARPA